MDTTYENYLLSKSRHLRIPLKTTLELTPLCNMDCKMCYVHELKNHLDHPIQTVDYWISLVPVLKEMGTLYITLIGGEPFLYPDIEKLYKLLSDHGFFVSFTTNGTLLADGLPDWLLKNKPKYVTVSLYGASDETYMKVTGNPHGFSQVMKAIQHLEEAEIPLQFNYSVIPENIDDLKKIFHLAKERNHIINASHYCYPNNSRREKEQENRLSPEKSAEVYWKIIRLNNQDGYFKHLQYVASEQYKQWNPESILGFTCNAGKSQMWINWKSQLSGCGILSGNLTQVAPENLNDLWKNLTEETEQITTSEECSQCKDWDICRPCPAKIYTETGIFKGTPKYICEITREIKKQAKSILASNGDGAF